MYTQDVEADRKNPERDGGHGAGGGSSFGLWALGAVLTAQGPRLNLKQANRRRVLFFMAFALLALTVVVAIWTVF